MAKSTVQYNCIKCTVNSASIPCVCVLYVILTKREPCTHDMFYPTGEFKLLGI
jgi:hypothetical protein